MGASHPIITCEVGAFNALCKDNPHNNYGETYATYAQALGHILLFIYKNPPQPNLCMNCFLFQYTSSNNVSL